MLRSLERNGSPGEALMFDIDKFKAINDRYGHAGGDAAIRAIAALYRAKQSGRNRVIAAGREASVG